jgi:hypothetical protein
MDRKILLSIFVLALLILPVSSASAQTTTLSASPAPRDLLINKVASKTANLKDTAKERLAQANTLKTQAASREASMAGKVASISGTLRAKLQSFRDKKKAATIERISDAITKINQRRSSQMLQHVDTMNSLANRTESRAISAQEAGTDVSLAMSEIQMAKTELAKAKTAVEDQSKKTYDINIASESGAKVAVKSTRDLLEQDLKATHGLVKEARRVLINALTKLAQSLGEGGTTNGTN